MQKKSRIDLVGGDGLKNSSVAVVHKIKTFKESDILRVLGQVGIKQAEVPKVLRRAHAQA